MLGLRRKLALVGLDTVLLSAAYVLAFRLRLGSDAEVRFFETILRTLPVVLIVSLFVHLRLGLFNAILRYASIDTAMAVIKSVLYSVLLSCLVLFLLFRLDGIPRSIFVIYSMAALLLVGGSRMAVRCWLTAARPPGASKRALLYGAGDTAEMVLRGLRMSRDLEYRAVGLIDDDPIKQGRHIHGLTIHGGVGEIPRVVETGGVDELWICVPDLAGERLRTVYEAASAHRIPVKILPRLEHTLLGADLAKFHEPDIADLLRRDPRCLDRDLMQRWISGRRVLITGAGGSIGSELARQVYRLGPSSLALCDASEANLFTIHRDLSSADGSVIQRPYLVDVRDVDAVRRMFQDARPEIVFHAAALKHVPMVEISPCEAVLTNVQGLASLSLAAVDSGVSEFVFISSDKAVRPVNVMGATKRLGEKMIQVLNRQGATRFMAVRFGNVLGSSGSVVPIFQEQIRRGGPVTVTHPEMTRYFMLVSEAVELVIQAGSIGRGGEIFVLDMGEPVKIMDMARDLIRLMGKEPDRDVRIVVTGPRPGEKIHEELLLSPGDFRTAFPDIWIDHEPAPETTWAQFDRELVDLIDAAKAGQRDGVVRALKRLVTRFAPVYEETRACLREPAAAKAAASHESVAETGPVGRAHARNVGAPE